MESAAEHPEVSIASTAAVRLNAAAALLVAFLLVWGAATTAWLFA